MNASSLDLPVNLSFEIDLDFGSKETGSVGLHRRLWQTVTADFQSITLHNVAGDRYRICPDWSAVLQAFAQPRHARSLIDKTSVPVTVYIQSENKRIDALFNGAQGAIRLFLNHIFLAANISAPGSCSFQGCSILSDHHSYAHYSRQNISLSGENFQFALWRHKVHHLLPPVGFVDYRKVRTWLAANLSPTAQRATTSTQRALFSICHLCYKYGGGPAGLVWLSHALEALYSTTAGHNVNALQNRAIQVLRIAKDKQDKFRKDIRNFYSTRSAFVHGGFRILHPFEDDRFDNNTDMVYEELYEPAIFGFTLVLSTIQTMVKRRWSEMKFQERHTGVITPSGA